MKSLIKLYLRPYWGKILISISNKMVATFLELGLPYILAHIIDEIVPMRQVEQVVLWGSLMAVMAIAIRQFNVWANQTAVDNAHLVSYDVRQALFTKTINLSGQQFDTFGLPSLISRMTSDSYNVQSFVQSMQTMCTRVPILLVGSVLATVLMDPVLAGIFCLIIPILFGVVMLVSYYGIPLYHRVQQRLDDVVRIMREDINGIRVVKALSKTEYEIRRFRNANKELMKADVLANTVMAVPGPVMQMCLNTGLTLVVWIGAQRVYSGAIKPGVILAFLTYFNMLMQGAMGINRIFMMLSKATASADRIEQILNAPDDQIVLPLATCPKPGGDEFIRFEHVGFSYSSDDRVKTVTDDERQKCLYDINFALKRGESLGIIGPTGCGKTTIINLLMRFYDVKEGAVFLAGRDVRTYNKDDLRRKFGVVFQNDMIFLDTLRENIRFGRPIEEPALRRAVEDAAVVEYINTLDSGLNYRADIKGANLSGGQKQRLLISRALAGNPDVLILDDASSALDYKTDAILRKALSEHYADTTTIVIAQRVSSVQNMTHILVMDEGRCIGYGKHETLLKTCKAYQEIFRAQMGSVQ